jgi:hypothetical protein
MVVWLTMPRRETTVGSATEDQIAELGRLTVTQLRQKYAEIFGEETFQKPAPSSPNYAAVNRRDSCGWFQRGSLYQKAPAGGRMGAAGLSEKM